MKQFVRLAVVAALFAAIATACSKDDNGSVAVNPTALFLSWGESVTVKFTGHNIAEYSISATPTGWEEPTIDLNTMTLLVTAPEEGSGAAETGTIRLRGRTHGNEYVHAAVYVALNTVEVDYSNQPANCYIANRPNAHYIFDATRNGNGETLKTASVAVIWQTSMNLVQYLSFDESEGKATFYLVADENDASIPKNGNALLGGYDAAGNLLWSWHIWITGYDPEATALDYGTYQVMSRQLGALANANSSLQEILDSYGVYYQWGRKDPFIGPSTYNASRGVAKTLYDSNSNTVTVQMVAADDETGDYAYTNAHPTHFLTTSDKNASWMRSELTSVIKGWHTNTKSVNDPCPYGWQVAPAAAFAGLQIANDLTVANAATQYAEAYGWNLTKGTTTSFYFAAGRRIYADGLIQNIYESTLGRNGALEFQPWVGYNWTADGAVFAFWFNKANPTESNLRNDLTMGAANGLSVRCVRTK